MWPTERLTASLSRILCAVLLQALLTILPTLGMPLPVSLPHVCFKACRPPCNLHCAISESIISASMAGAARCRTFCLHFTWDYIEPDGLRGLQNITQLGSISFGFQNGSLWVQIPAWLFLFLQAANPRAHCKSLSTVLISCCCLLLQWIHITLLNICVCQAPTKTLTYMRAGSLSYLIAFCPGLNWYVKHRVDIQ